jgi:hypothetical protein
MAGCSEKLRVRATPKQSLKRVEIPLSKFRDVAVPYHIDLLKKHKVNIEKVRFALYSTFISSHCFEINIGLFSVIMFQELIGRTLSS